MPGLLHDGHAFASTVGLLDPLADHLAHSVAACRLMRASMFEPRCALMFCATCGVIPSSRMRTTNAAVSYAMSPPSVIRPLAGRSPTIMGQLLHGRTTTTATVRLAIQYSQESLRGLAKRYGVNHKTTANWKQRSSAADRPTGPRQPHPTSLSVEEEAVIVAFRRHTLLRWMTACMPFSPPYRNSHAPRCIGASSDTASLDCPSQIARKPQKAV